MSIGYQITRVRGTKGLSSQAGFFSDRRRSGIDASEEATRGPGFDLRRIGEFLKGTRERKGLSLGDVSKALFLTKSTIQAIESGSWDFLPHAFYVKGYARSYAYHLDISEEVEELLRPFSEPCGRTTGWPCPGKRGGPTGKKAGQAGSTACP